MVAATMMSDNKTDDAVKKHVNGKGGRPLALRLKRQQKRLENAKDPKTKAKLETVVANLKEKLAQKQNGNKNNNNNNIPLKVLQRRLKNKEERLTKVQDPARQSEIQKNIANLKQRIQQVETKQADGVTTPRKSLKQRIENKEKMLDKVKNNPDRRQKLEGVIANLKTKMAKRIRQRENAKQHGNRNMDRTILARRERVARNKKNETALLKIAVDQAYVEYYPTDQEAYAPLFKNKQRAMDGVDLAKRARLRQEAMENARSAEAKGLLLSKEQFARLPATWTVEQETELFGGAKKKAVAEPDIEVVETTLKDLAIGGNEPAAATEVVLNNTTSKDAADDWLSVADDDDDTGVLDDNGDKLDPIFATGPPDDDMDEPKKGGGGKKKGGGKRAGKGRKQCGDAK